MGRSPTCCSTGNHLKKGPWTVEEDRVLMDYIEKNGRGSWRLLAKNSGLNRCGKSCRLRWINYLNPEIKRGKFSEDEERIIINLHSTLGNKWSKIAAHLPGRTDNEIKNFWNSRVKKKLLSPSTQQISHLHSLLNIYHSIDLNNPWNNIASIKPLINHYATTQLLQNILQTMNGFLVPSIEETNLMQNYNRHPQVNQLKTRGETIDYRYQYLSINNHSKAFIRYLNPNILSSDNVCDIANSLTSSGGGGIGQPCPCPSLDPTNSEIYNVDNLVDNLISNASFSETPSENWPISTLDHSSISRQFDKMQQKDDHDAFCSNPELDVYEEWEKLVDDETNNSLWRDIIEWNQEAI